MDILESALPLTAKQLVLFLASKILDIVSVPTFGCPWAMATPWPRGVQGV